MILVPWGKDMADSLTTINVCCINELPSTVVIVARPATCISFCDTLESLTSAGPRIVPRGRIDSAMMDGIIPVSQSAVTLRDARMPILIGVIQYPFTAVFCWSVCCACVCGVFPSLVYVSSVGLSE